MSDDHVSIVLVGEKGATKKHYLNHLLKDDFERGCQTVYKFKDKDNTMHNANNQAVLNTWYTMLPMRIQTGKSLNLYRLKYPAVVRAYT